MRWTLIKSRLAVPLEIYRTQKSILEVGRYFGRLISRRGPSAIRRRIETRRSLDRLATKAPELEANIRVAVLVQGAVGDNVIAARFLRDLSACCPSVVFDVYTADVALGRWIYSGVAAVRDCLQDTAFAYITGQYHASFLFDGMIRLTAAIATFPDDHSGRFQAVLTSIRRFHEKHGFHGSAPYNYSAILAQELFFKHSERRATGSHFIASLEYGGDQYSLPAEDNVLAKFDLYPRSYVTIHNGFEVALVTYGARSTKVYPRFGDVVKDLRNARPEITIVQIGASTSTAIEGVDLNLIGQTSLREAASLLKGACCHLDNDSGLVHIASCYGTPCCVVFGPSSPDYFSYEMNAAIRPPECGGCWWITKDWDSRCPRGMAEPVCTYRQPASVVAKAALQLLSSRH